MSHKFKFIIIIAVVLIFLWKITDIIKSKDVAAKHRISVSGTIEATQIGLSFQVGGQIKQLLIDEGDFVRKNDVVAILDQQKLIALKTQAEASYREAKLSYERLKKDFNRAENLYKAGAVPQQQRDAVKTSYAIAKAKMEKLKASLRLAELNLSYAKLRAPIDGFVIVKSAEAGEVVQPGACIFTMVDLTHIWLTAYIEESDLGKVRLGQKAEIKTDSYPRKSYPARISFISQEAEFTPKYIQTHEERTKLVYRIKIRVDNHNYELKPGMPADAYINLN